MRDFWIALRCYAGRFKLVSALLSLFISGALVAIGLTAWHYDSSLSRQQAAYEGQIHRLETSLNAEREENRERLDTVRLKIESVAHDIDNVSDAVGRLMELAQSVSKTASRAASTAQKAATTAQGAAKNAAQANIAVTEIKPDPPKQSPFPERIEH